MSKVYSLGSLIHASFTVQNIEKILKKGLELGLTYHDDTIELTGDEYFPLLSLEKAVLKAYSSCELAEDELYTAGIYTKIGEAYCIIWFYKKANTQILFNMGAFSPDYKIFKYSTYHIDFARYSHISLEMTKPFKLIEFKTSTLY